MFGDGAPQPGSASSAPHFVPARGGPRARKAPGLCPCHFTTARRMPPTCSSSTTSATSLVQRSRFKLGGSQAVLHPTSAILGRPSLLQGSTFRVPWFHPPWLSCAWCFSRFPLRSPQTPFCQRSDSGFVSDFRLRCSDLFRIPASVLLRRGTSSFGFRIWVPPCFCCHFSALGSLIFRYPVTCVFAGVIPYLCA